MVFGCKMVVSVRYAWKTNENNGEKTADGKKYKTEETIVA